MEENKICYAVRDLLPLYKDRLAGEDSNKLIEEHLKSCPQCLSYYEEYQKKQDEASQEETKSHESFRILLKRYRYETIGFISGVSLVFLIILVMIITAIIRGSSNETRYSVSEHTEDITAYGRQSYTGISELALFPEASCMTGEILDFYYDCKGNSLYQDYQIYLECAYSMEAYLAEKERLLNIHNAETGTKVVYTDEEFCLPGVYAMLYDEAYEYAVWSDTECTVTYCCLQGVDRRNLYFNPSLLPKDYGQYGYEFETERKAFRIYPKNN